MNSNIAKGNTHEGIIGDLPILPSKVVTAAMVISL